MKLSIFEELTPMAHVLIVEDEPDVAVLYSSILTQYGHIISEANNGQDALALLANPNYYPNVAIIDINLKVGMSGFGVIDVIREDPRLQNCKILVVTANDWNRDYAFQHGVD